MVFRVHAYARDLLWQVTVCSSEMRTCAFDMTGNIVRVTQQREPSATQVRSSEYCLFEPHSIQMNTVMPVTIVWTRQVTTT